MTLKRKLSIVAAASSHAESAHGYKVAFASADRKVIDQHFGTAEGFVIYGVSPDGYELLEVTQFGRLDMDGNEDKLGAKIEVLADCVAVYCQAIGASAIGKLRTAGVQPIKVPPQTPISHLLSDLQRELQEGPSGWLARAIEQREPRTENRFDLMEAEGWSE